MDLTKEFPSKFLKINNNCKHGDIILFTNEGEIEERKDSKGNDRKNFIIGVRVERTGDELLFNVNVSNRKTTEALYGSYTKDWVNKPMQINLTKVRNPQTGQMVDSIILSKPEDGNF